MTNARPNEESARSKCRRFRNARKVTRQCVPGTSSFDPLHRNRPTITFAPVTKTTAVQPRSNHSMSNSIAKTPTPPYYAVIFTSLRTDGDRGYGHMAERMFELAAGQPGFLGWESARTPDGLGITVSYWTSEESITAWKAHTSHKVAQETGARVWYSDSKCEWRGWRGNTEKPTADPGGRFRAANDQAALIRLRPSVASVNGHGDGGHFVMRKKRTWFVESIWMLNWASGPAETTTPPIGRQMGGLRESAACTV